MNTHGGRFLNVSRVLVSLALLSSTHLATANAEPITAIYQIQITQRHATANGVSVGGPFNQQFPLRVTIDPAQSTEFDPFGSPTFSPVPLQAVTAPDELLPLQVIGRMNLVVSGGELSTYVEELISETGGPANSFTYFRSALLSVSVPQSDTPPVLDAQSFLRLLGGGFGGNPSFSYRSFSCTEGFSAENCADFSPPSFTAISFEGTATLQQIESPATPEPIPEPATVALVGSGVVLLLKRHYSSRKKV